MNFANDSVDEERYAALVALIEKALSLTARPPSEPEASVCFHEAGHAVVDHANGVTVSRVWVAKNAGAAHASIKGGPVDAILDDPTTEAVKFVVVGALAGVVAEAMTGGRPGWRRAMGDLAVADQFAHMACESVAQADALVGECVRDAERLLRERWTSVTGIAEALAKHGEVGGRKLEALLASNQLARSSKSAKP